MEIILNIYGENGIAERHISKPKQRKSGNTEDSVTRFTHKTAAEYPILPYSTKWDKKYYDDFVYFDGIMGACFRLITKKNLPKNLIAEDDYNRGLKKVILDNVTNQIKSDKKYKFRQIVDDMFFQDNQLYSFSRDTLPYLFFKNKNPTLKEISSFIFKIFFDEDLIREAATSKLNKTNILYKLLKLSLPELEEDKGTLKEYLTLNSEIISCFKDDFLKINESENIFLADIKHLFKYYYFLYVSQVVLTLNDFFEKKTHPVYFTLESEIVSKSRYCYTRGWYRLENKIENLFSHANTLELLNYITIGGKKVGSYIEFKQKYLALDNAGKEQVIAKLKELKDFYKSKISKPDTGWEECDIQLQKSSTFTQMDCPFERAVFSLWFTIDFQFLNTARKKPYGQYKSWFSEFCRANFIKRRGRIGFTLRLSQEMLLFLTKLAIGNENKIRLKKLWKELERRGVYFDDTSKMEVVRLFEKINLIEKKSDSGDAQYVRAIL